MRIQRTWSVVAVVVMTVSLTAPAASAAKGGGGPGGGGGTTAGEPVPASMASLGDSITQAFNACGWYIDCPSRSWSTGDGSDSVASHFERLRALDPSMTTEHNVSRSGTKVADLPGQAQTAVSRGVGYITVLIGANDACTSSESTMTTVDAFRSSFASAMATLGASNAKVFAASIPDIYRLWQVGKSSGSARSAWSGFGICQSMLANPTSTDPADEARRQRVRQRVIDFNAVITEVCAAHVNCRYDGGAVFGYPFVLSQMSGWDYFHPNESGQAVLAETTFAAGYTWAKAAKGGGRK